MKRIKLFLFSLFSPSFWPHSLQPIVALLFCVHFLYFALDKMSCSFFFFFDVAKHLNTFESLWIHIKSKSNKFFLWKFVTIAGKIMMALKELCANEWCVYVDVCVGGKYRKIIIIYKAVANLPLSRNGHDGKSDKIENPKT